MFFSITSWKRGGGGKSSPSIKNGIRWLSAVSLFPPFSLLSAIALLGFSLKTSSSPYNHIQLHINPERSALAKQAIQFEHVNWMRDKTWKHSYIMLLPFFELLRSECRVLRSHDMNSTGSDRAPILNRFLLDFITAWRNSCGLTYRELGIIKSSISVLSKNSTTFNVNSSTFRPVLWSYVSAKSFVWALRIVEQVEICNADSSREWGRNFSGVLLSSATES